MKLYYFSLVIVLAVLTVSGCRSKTGQAGSRGNAAENTSASDTGFTGIKKMRSGGHIVMEANYRNGIQDGLTTTYYESGKVRGTTMFRNGLKQDSAKWYFEEGQLFRSTPYRNDTIEGIQKQYYRNGRLKARIGFKKGLRTFEFEEFDLNGKKYAGYPELIVNTKDEYAAKGTFTVLLTTSDKAAKVRYFRGDFSNGLFDSTKCEKVRIVNGAGVLNLQKTGTQQAGSVDVLASIMSPYGNSYLVYKKVNLPYRDLK